MPGNRQWTGAVDATCSIRQQGTSTWNQLWSLAADEPPADAFLYRQRVLDISSWVGQTVEFRFRVAGTSGADFALDDVIVGDFDPTTTAQNDLCANATPLASVFSIEDVSCYAANDLDPFTGPSGSCIGNELSGPDLFYELSVAAGDTLQASIAAEWGPGLYLIDDCSTPTCLAGLYAEDGRVLPFLEYEFPTTGTYYLVVDGEGGSCGPFELTGEILPTAVGIVKPLRDIGDLSLSAFPNPSRNVVLVRGQLRSALGEVVSLAIFDVAGKKVLDVNVPVSGSDLSFEWDRRDSKGDRVSAGTYFIRVHAGPQVLETKVTLIP